MISGVASATLFYWDLLLACCNGKTKIALWIIKSWVLPCSKAVQHMGLFELSTIGFITFFSALRL
jgi:hypothetical protein